MLPIRCPDCHSQELRASTPQSIWEHILRIVGLMPVRCKNCDYRFRSAIWDILNAIYARCPACYNLELSIWQPRFYRPPAGQRLKLRLGGRPRRCERCRRNFVSFLPCKIRYRRKTASSAA